MKLCLPRPSDAVSAREGIERIVELAPTFYQVKDHRDLAKSICQAAKDTFSSLSCSIYRAAPDSLVLLERVPETELLRRGTRFPRGRSPGLREALRSSIRPFSPTSRGESLGPRQGPRCPSGHPLLPSGSHSLK